MDFHTPEDSDVSEPETNFVNPPFRYAPRVRWVWSGLATDSALIEQLRLMHHCGIHGAIVQLAATNVFGGHSRSYLTQLQHVAREADPLGFRLWLHFPDPGMLFHGAGNRALNVHQWDTTPGKWKKVRLSKPVIQATAFPIPVDLTSFHQSDAVDVTEPVRNFETPDGLRPDASYRVFVFTESAGSPGSEESPIQDIELVLDEYLGSVIEAVVCGMEPPSVGANALPWMEGLQDSFATDHRYDLLPYLTSLLHDTGQAALRHRQNFWETWLKHHIRSTWQPLKSWCAQKHLQLVGEYRKENSCGDPLRDLSHLASTSSTLDGWLVTTDSGADEISVARLLSSVARQHGGDMYLDASSCRSPLHQLLARYSGEEVVGWVTHAVADTVSLLGLEDEQMRWLFPIASEPPPVCLNAVHRIAQVVGASSSRKQAALLLPTRSIWVEPLLGESDLHPFLERDFEYLAHALQAMHFNCDLVCEWDLVHADVLESVLRVGAMSYEILVLPSLTALSRFAWAKIMELVKHGGKVAAFGLLPMVSEMGHEEEFALKIRADTRTDVLGLYEAYRTSRDEALDLDIYPVFCEDHSGGRFCSFQPTLCQDQETARLRMHQVIRESLAPEFESQHESLRYQLRRMTREDDIFDRYLCVVSNLSDGQASSKVQLNVAGTAEHLSLSTGEITPVLNYSWLSDHQLSLPMELDPGETRVIRIHESQVGPRVEAANFHVERLELPDGGPVIGGSLRLEDLPPFALVDSGTEVASLQARVSGAIVQGELDTPWSLAQPRAWLPFPKWQSRVQASVAPLATRLGFHKWSEWADFDPTLLMAADEPADQPRVLELRTSFMVQGKIGTIEILAEPLPGNRKYSVNKRHLTVSLVTRWGYPWLCSSFAPEATRL